ncbi:ribosomal RNA-processing protein 12-like [Teratosphaeria destructans]|uniref:Ribosomal RNA-processing protein 12-like n=1 Tax=Teratosphaeria destructans TaxID=418781 RepID=A0A9W7SSC3_9PEZI|nr:ribosomal RNA-processing protein 12-like [Teratosphaeria destructans]
MSSLQERLDKIRSSPKLQNQQQTAVVLNAIEDTLRQQKSEPTPTAYFAALLSLLGQYISLEKGLVNKEVAYAVVYLLDLVTNHVPAPLLRSKFPQILGSLAPALTHPEAEAPLLRASIGCLESLLVAQDSQAWALPQSSSSPRGAVGGLLALAMDHRPKVRKRAQEALDQVLRHPPPSPSLDHPAADMCAETALRSLQVAADETAAQKKNKKHKREEQSQHDPNLMHALQLVKSIATAENGWPSKKIDALCELLLNISRGSNGFLTMAAFEVFEIIFAGLADEVSSAKLPKLLDAIKELQPSQNDSQLLPPWIAVLSRGYEVAAQIEPEETFHKLPELVKSVSSFLTASSHNIRISASECLISLLNTCIPDQVILEPSIMDDKALEKVAKTLQDLLSVKYQAAWMEVFNVMTAAFEVLKWQSHPLLDGIVHSIGDLRGNDSFAGKKEADAVLSAAIRAMGPDNVLAVLPLNLSKPKAGQAGRAWLLPILRDSVSNTRLAHFRSELVPLSEAMFQRVLNHGTAEKTMEIKIFETVVSQIWACLPGYCELPLDLREAVDQSFAEQVSNLLYQQPQMRTDICKALQNLVDTNKAIVELELDGEDHLIQQGRVTKEEAKKNLRHLAGFAGNLLAVLFNVYSQTLPHNRGNLLQCINAYLSITPESELMETFERVAAMLESSLAEVAAAQEGGKKQQASSDEAKNKMPPTSHTLMDLVITMSIHLPRQAFAGLFNMAANIVNAQNDPQLQKKAYKLIPRLADSEIGRQAIQERNDDLQRLLIAAADKASGPAKRDRLSSITQIIPFLPQSDLHFIPSVLSEVVIGVKEVNEKARNAAFDLLVLMGAKMSEGGKVINAKVPGMSADAPSADASLEEYFTMVSAGLAGSTPHMISASITALTRLLYEFRQKLKQETITDLVQTMDLFLTSNNREIVQSVLGFVKVCVISLPSELMLPRLQTLVPNLVVWSHEHKARFKAKVKHIFERMIRRFGVEIVEQWTPESDKKLIANIRKTRDRRKRRKEEGVEDDAEVGAQERRKGRFESEYDEAVYGSESDGAESEDISDDEVLGRAVEKGRKANPGGKQYIMEDADEPLDLLDRKALANISSTKPVRNRGAPADGARKNKAQTDLDGKLVFNEDSDSDADIMDFDDAGMQNGREPGDGTLDGGINAYVNALKGRDAPQRGQKGKLKFSNKRDRSGEVDDEDDAMEVDAGELSDALKKQQRQRGRGDGQKPQRKSLDGGKIRAQHGGGGTGGGGIRKARGGAFKHGLQRRRGKGGRR